MTTNGRPLPDELLSALYDGELTAAERAAAEQLLEESADARSELEDYRSLSELLRSLPSEPAPPGLRQAVMNRIATSVATAQARRPRRWGWFAGAAGLAIAASLVIAVFVREGPARRGMVVADRGSAETPSAARGAGTAMEADSAAIENLALEGSASSALPPSSEFAIGQMFSYFEQTPDDGIVVVQATVVDVHRARDQLQVLLSKNSIPTAPVALFDESAEQLGRLPVSGSSSELAVYVEADPSQVNATLLDLGRSLGDESNYFVEFKVAGLLNPTGAASARSESGQGSGPRFTAAGRGRTTEDSYAAGAEPSTSNSAPLDATTLNAESSGRRQPPAALPNGPATRESADIPAAEDVSQGNSSEFGTYRYGYQRVLNISKAELDRQLREQPAEESRQGNVDEGLTPQSRLSFQSERPEVEAMKSYDKIQQAPAEGQAAQANRAFGRRQRLLVVLEPVPATMLKAKSRSNAAPATPVEAPRPRGPKG